MLHVVNISAHSSIVRPSGAFSSGMLCNAAALRPSRKGASRQQCCTTSLLNSWQRHAVQAVQLLLWGMPHLRLALPAAARSLAAACALVGALLAAHLHGGSSAPGTVSMLTCVKLTDKAAAARACSTKNQGWIQQPEKRTWLTPIARLYKLYHRQRQQ